MPRIIFMSRGEYVRGFVIGFAGGFVTHRWMDHSALTPQWRGWIETAVVIAMFIAVLVDGMRRRKTPLEEP